jgi:hypothetical protein
VCYSPIQISEKREICICRVTVRVEYKTISLKVLRVRFRKYLIYPVWTRSGLVNGAWIERLVFVICLFFHREKGINKREDILMFLVLLYLFIPKLGVDDIDTHYLRRVSSVNWPIYRKKTSYKCISSLKIFSTNMGAHLWRVLSQIMRCDNYKVIHFNV